MCQLGYIFVKEETIFAGLFCEKTSEMAWEILAEEANDYINISDYIVTRIIRVLTPKRR